MKPLIICLIAQLPFFQTVDPPRNDAVRHAVSRNVFVETETNFGSGVIVETGKVLTCYHVVEEYEKGIEVSKKPAEFIRWDEETDLALLKVETPKVGKVRFNLSPKVTEQVFSVSNPMQHNGLVAFGRIIFLSEMVETDTLSLPGSSGGGLYDTDGKLVGLTQAVEGSPQWGYKITLHIKASVLKAFIEKK